MFSWYKDASKGMGSVVPFYHHYGRVPSSQWVVANIDVYLYHNEFMDGNCAYSFL